MFKAEGSLAFCFLVLSSIPNIWAKFPVRGSLFGDLYFFNLHNENSLNTIYCISLENNVWYPDEVNRNDSQQQPNNSLL